MFGPQTFLQAVIEQVYTDLKLGVPLLRAYARKHADTDLGKQAAELAKLCRNTTIPARFRQLVEALTPEGQESFTPKDWALVFSTAAALIGPPKREMNAPEPSVSRQKGLRYILKRRSRILHRRVTNPRHPWPEELKQTLIAIGAATIIINRLRSECKRWQRDLERLAGMARFLGGDTSV